MVVTVGLQDISSKYITLETSYVFIFMFIIQDLSWLDFASVDPGNIVAAIVHFITRVYVGKIKSSQFLNNKHIK